MTRDQTILRIGSLADRYGVSPESIRVWERQGRIPPAGRTPGGHRRYGREHVSALDALFATTPDGESPGAGAPL